MMIFKPHLNHKKGPAMQRQMQWFFQIEKRARRNSQRKKQAQLLQVTIRGSS